MFTHSKNSQFQYLYFIVGKCHTADEAYRVIKDQYEDRVQAIKSAEAGVLRAKAKQIKAQKVLKSRFAGQVKKLEAEADLAEMAASADIQKTCYDEAVRERDFLQGLLERLEPFRKYRDLPEHEAMQACQREEWGRELLLRAENHVFSSGTVPADQFAAMRLHPDFQKEIGPRVMGMLALRKQGKFLLSTPPKFVGALCEGLGVETKALVEGVRLEVKELGVGAAEGANVKGSAAVTSEAELAQESWKSLPGEKKLREVRPK